MSLNPKVTKDSGGTYWLNWTPDPTAGGYAFTTPGGASRTFNPSQSKTKLGKPAEPFTVTISVLDVTSRAPESASYPPVTPPPPSGLLLGLNNEARLGVKIVRSYGVSRFDSTTKNDGLVLANAKAGAETILLLDDNDLSTNVGNIQALAKRYGPGGDFWQAGGAGFGQFASRYFEYMNEISYEYKNGNGAGGSYATSFKAAQQALAAGNSQAGLLCIGDDGDSGSSQWFDLMFQAVPDLGSRTPGFTIHPYGPKVDRLTRDHGFLSSHVSNPQLFVTEDGISSDDGRTLDDNYGYPKNMTYQQTATAHKAKHDAVAALPYVPVYVIYKARDDEPHGATNGREDYFGVCKQDGSDKPFVSDMIRSLA